MYDLINTGGLYLALGLAVNYFVEKFKELREKWEWLAHWLDKTWELEAASCVVGILVALAVKLGIVVGDGPVILWLAQQGVPVGPFASISWWGFAINGFIAGFLTTSWFKFFKGVRK